MYLKSLEVCGFKSFADKTKLMFEPGMTAIVGPNGCGKSNVSDAIRWVLGEQSAKALRGAKMEDCIFNGTDLRKPLGMAEVAITFADAEKALGMEYNEVTITRRVFRSGEGQYFLNKTPCRLKDIQRLFMDTGIGTDSYSFMEQGRIDKVLSSRPEDRRAIFEEASGITKYKADKKEALRKLEATEANLLRLADVIREVKRQIGSLQRQAGKARRYKELSDLLRSLDLYAIREKGVSLEVMVDEFQTSLNELNVKIAAEHSEIGDMERGTAALHGNMMNTEREIGSVLEAAMQARGKLDHTKELIAVNRRSIEEYKTLSDRDVGEIEQIQGSIERANTELRETAARLLAARERKATAESDLKQATERYERHQQQVASARSRTHELREMSVELESVMSRVNNQLAEFDARRHSAVIQHERLLAEQAQLRRIAADYEARQEEMTRVLAELGVQAREGEERIKALESEQRERQQEVKRYEQECQELRSSAAARRAQIDMLASDKYAQGDFPGGARLLLDKANPLKIDKSRVIGSLASLLDVDEAYRKAAEAALRPWLDAIVVSAEQGVEILGGIAARRAGPARLLLADLPAPDSVAKPAGDRLADHVRTPDSLAPLMHALIGNTIVVESLAALPAAPWLNPFVTHEGCVVRPGGGLEFWMTEPNPANPLTRKHLLADTRLALEKMEKALAERTAAIAEATAIIGQCDQKMTAARGLHEQAKRALAQKEGENRLLTKESTEARERLETVSWEIQNMAAQEQDGAAEREALLLRKQESIKQREEITSQTAEMTRSLHDLERDQSVIQNDLADRRVRFSDVSHEVERLSVQQTGAESRIKELEQSRLGRNAGIDSYRNTIGKLAADIAAAEAQLETLHLAVQAQQDKAEALRLNRDKQAAALKESDAALTARRTVLEKLLNEKSGLDVSLAENKMRRQNMLERAYAEYNATWDQIKEHPEPVWGEAGKPPFESVETEIAELRTKIEAMGPVNLVAIEEYRELEERHSFLCQQEADLLASKDQLHDMIRKINSTTSDMFSATFAAVNENFQKMFEKLFNGGTAKLVLVNEEDVLECGIEIIARPPGKRLQNVSLLSGGERTMTAVALLFAIYMIKPSPFCMLDELDAPLDDSNIGRFVSILKEFLSQSQFVVITHNRQTIAAGSSIYGVTMPEKGISRIVSMKFKDVERAPQSAGILN